MGEALITITPVDEKFWKLVGEVALPPEPDEDFIPGQERLPIELPSKENE